MACSPSKPLPWTPTPHTHTPCFVPCERMWPGSHPRGGVNPNDGLLRHIAQPWASLSSWPPQPLGRDPLVHTGRGLQSGLDRPARVCPVYKHPVPSYPAMPCLTQIGYTHPGLTAWSSSSEDSATGCRPVVSMQYTMSRAPQLCVCVFITGDSYAQWNKDAVNHNQMGVCAGCGGEGGRGSEEVGGGVWVSWMFRGMPRPNVGRWRLRAEGGMPHLGKWELGCPGLNGRPVYQLNEYRSYGKVSLNKRSYQTIVVYLCFTIRNVIAI